MLRDSKNRKISTIKSIRYLIEAGFAMSFMFLFKLLPYRLASDIGSIIITTLLSPTKIYKLAKANIKRALPNLSNLEVEEIAIGTLNNLGRSIGEFPKIATMSDKDFANICKVTNEKHLKELEKKGGLIFTAHMANWEFITRYFSMKNNKAIGVYRKANNSFVDNIIYQERAKQGIKFIPKGKEGAKEIIAEIKAKKIIVMLVDQRMDDGIAVPFFGKDAMTAPAIASLALKYKLPILGLQVIRHNTYNIELKFHAPIEYQDTGNKVQDELSIMKKINKTLEDWIKENPEQWFWVHNRWK